MRRAGYKLPFIEDFREQPNSTSFRYLSLHACIFRFTVAQLCKTKNELGGHALGSASKQDVQLGAASRGKLQPLSLEKFEVGT